MAKKTPQRNPIVTEATQDAYDKNAEHWTNEGNHNPGTPDDDVNPERMHGRQAARHGVQVDDNPHPHGTPGGRRIAWYLGWYDVRLAKFYVK